MTPMTTIDANSLEASTSPAEGLLSIARGLQPLLLEESERNEAGGRLTDGSSRRSPTAD